MDLKVIKKYVFVIMLVGLVFLAYYAGAHVYKIYTIKNNSYASLDLLKSKSHILNDESGDLYIVLHKSTCAACIKSESNIVKSLNGKRVVQFDLNKDANLKKNYPKISTVLREAAPDGVYKTPLVIKAHRENTRHPWEFVSGETMNFSE